MLTRLCSCHVQADLCICQSCFSFDYMKGGGGGGGGGQYVISVPPYNKSLFPNGTTSDDFV